MNQKSFNTWLRELGYSWKGQEQMIKGFMSQTEAEELISSYVSQGMVIFNGR